MFQAFEISSKYDTKGNQEKRRKCFKRLKLVRSMTQKETRKPVCKICFESQQYRKKKEKKKREEGEDVAEGEGKRGGAGKRRRKRRRKRRTREEEFVTACVLKFRQPHNYGHRRRLVGPFVTVLFLLFIVHCTELHEDTNLGIYYQWAP